MSVGPRSRAGDLAAIGVLVALLLLPGAARPNDALVSQQTHHDVIGTFDAWDVRRGEGAVVAVLDTGVDLDHPDLTGRLVEGVDLVEPDTPPDDPQGHGTIVAGLVAAVAGNGRGVAGVAPQAQIMPIRVLDERGTGTSDVVAEGIRHAIEQEVQVINLSLAEVQEPDEGDDGGESDRPLAPAPPVLEGASLVEDREVVAAIEEAAEAGILVVAAAGNDGKDETPYDEDVPVLVVGASEEDDSVWEDSNRDDRTLFAPGVEILSTWSEGRYAKSSGTSFATPIVAAGAAMLMGAGLTAEEAVERLLDTAVPLEPPTGVGRVDLPAAVEGLPAAPPPPPPPTPTTTPTPAQPTPTPEDPSGTPGPSADPGPLEAAEPVQEVPEQPTPTRVTEAPPPVETGATQSPAPTPPPTAVADGDPASTDPPATPTDLATTRDPPTSAATGPADLQVDGGASADERAAAITIATMLLGVDVALAGWVLAGRRG